MYLNCHTYHSLRYGTLSPEQLVRQAVRNGIRQLALTDINTTTAIPEFVKLCREHGIRPVAGVEFRRGDQPLYVVLARNPEGFLGINRFLSQHNISKTPLPMRFPVCENTFVIYPVERFPGQSGETKRVHGDEPLHPHEYAGIRPGEILRLIASPLQQGSGNMVHLLKDRKRLLALHTVSFGGEADHELHRHLRAIDHNTVLSKLQRGQTGAPEHVMLTEESLGRLYGSTPFLTRNAAALLEQCVMDFDFGSLKNKKTFTGHPADDRALLGKLAIDGLEYRYGKGNTEAGRRVRHELEVIDKLGFSAYFLITWDIIRYSMSRGFYHVGRGSGANSIVAYCLRITDVDPIELDLYFERFINPKRSTPPDFDIDYSWKERDQVLDYIFKRYGHEHTALLGTCSTFRERSMMRELGKVYGLPKGEIDTLAGQRRSWIQTMEEAGPDSLAEKIFAMAARLDGFPNLRSIHAGGVLISERPICCYSALDLPPKGLPTVQWDMYTAEDLGFEKIDILSQRGIGHINECTAIIRRNHGLSIDVHRVEDFKKDEKVKALLRSGETTGCFYVESPAMRGLLKKLRCDNYISLVAASSIIRPGVARSGMMREYIQRFHRPGSFEYLHPVMEQQLKETFGVMVYQEDVIKVCHHFAGLDLADADVLRRAMSGKYRSKKEMQRIVDRFFVNCRKKGYPETLIREVWRQIESFAGYSFSKAHSASFAVESYQSLYLKAHYPLEFMTAVINNFGGFYQSPVYFNEASRYGARIEPPCVNHSEYNSMVTGSTIYMGFVHALNLEGKTAGRIIAERGQGGSYRGLEDFCSRTGTGLEQLILLIRMGALRFTGRPKARLLWEAHMLAGKKPPSDNMLFPLPETSIDLPGPETDPLQDAYDEMELLGFPVSTGLFDMLKTSFRGDIFAEDMLQYTGRSVRMLGWLVAIKYVRTVKKEMMYFGCFLDSRGNFFDSVHFPGTARDYPFRGNGIYLLKGVIAREFGFPSLTVEKMAKMPLRPVR
jgi:error-prone DNA polymerase